MTAGCLAIDAVVGAIAAAGGAGADVLAEVAAMALATVGYTVVILVGALRRGADAHPVSARRVRQEFRLNRRSWLELETNAAGAEPAGATSDTGAEPAGATVWVPVFSDPALSAMPSPTDVEFDGQAVSWSGVRLLRSGRISAREPAGRLVDNPSGVGDARQISWSRRLLLDAQPAVAGPVLGIMWVAILGGGIPVFTGATVVCAGTAIWLSAIRGSDAG